ncbi:MAG: leucyl-tRNA synthetase [Patescibacteria group bacterium]|jgi:leucyl-tRNA synthetase|nr:leucyl-tRNA synthetase [Patescibacteria group bacterium]
MAKPYDHKEIEGKWQKFWEEKGVYKTENPPIGEGKPKYYVLDMFPYPSGAGLHVGHPRGYIGSDVLSRMRRMQGFNVLHPMGFDAFGLPAEQYAIQTGEHPSVITEKAIDTYKKQLEIIGLSYDWSREVRTIDPGYYKWTQWIFLKLFDSYFDEVDKKAKSISELVAKFEKEDPAWSAKSEKEKEDLLMNYRLAYEGYSEVNWCPELGTVLANDEIVDGGDGKPVSERGGFPVEKKNMRQWFLRITSYADRLLSGLESIDWPEHIKEIQRNWIGRSEGAEIEFGLKDGDEKIKVFTTRPDTLFGVTFVAVPGEKERFTGKYAINPANGEQVPIWEAPYVMEGYGTGAVMGVPAHDERDFEFAKRNGLYIKNVILPNYYISKRNESKNDLEKEGFDLLINKIINGDSPYAYEGILSNSDQFSGLNSEEAKQKITEFVGGKMVTKYKMRDAIFARQRYWGEPIPLKRVGDVIKPLSENELPLELPNVSSYKPAGNGESPLAGVSEWVEKGFETNTMPGWAGSSWYFLRYMDPKNSEAFAGKDTVKYWQDVDVYVGGAEHATGHLLYSRFWHKFLHDLGYVPTEEPFKLLKNQGLILASDGRKMSKRWGNVVNPDEMVDRFGADSFRLYEMFIGPFDQYTSWNTDGLVGTRRFLERVWRAKERIGEPNQEVDILVNKTIKKITEDIENFRFNTSVSSMMILVNKMEEAPSFSKENYLSFLQILAPFAPHMTEELWHKLGETSSIHKSNWPKADDSKLKDEKIKIAVQVNGKVRDEIEISPDASEEDVKELALSKNNISEIIKDQSVKNFIYVKGKIVNIVI